MKKIFLVLFTLTVFSGCSLSFSGNPDQENFDKEYIDAPDFSQEENKVLNGE